MEELIELMEELCGSNDFKASENLMNDGILNSLDIVQLSADIENTFDVEITPIDVTPDNFKTVDSIYAMIQRLQDED